MGRVRYFVLFILLSFVSLLSFFIIDSSRERSEVLPEDFSFNFDSCKVDLEGITGFDEKICIRNLLEPHLDDENILEKVISDGEKSRYACHSLVHELGYLKFREYLDREVPDNCGDGFMHGMMIALAESGMERELGDIVSRRCIDSVSVELSSQCFHGVGHALSSTFSIDKIFLACYNYSLRSYDLSNNCVNGWFMESSLSKLIGEKFFSYYPEAVLENSDIKRLCEGYRDRVDLYSICLVNSYKYNFSNLLISKEEINIEEEGKVLISYCDALGSRLRENICFLSAGYVSSVLSRFDGGYEIGDIRSFCREDFMASCMRGYFEQIGSILSGDEYSKVVESICNLSDMKDECLKIGESYVKSKQS